MIANLSEGEITRAIINELISGRRFKDAQEKARERVAAQEAFASRGHKSIKGLGKLAVSIPEDDYYDLVGKYGTEAFADRGFIRDLQRLEPQFKVHNV